MSKPTLIRTNGPMIPGGYQFTCPITGKVYRDLDTLFDGRVRQVVNDRAANRRLVSNASRLDPVNVGLEISIANCERLRNNPTYCVGGAQSQRMYSTAPPAEIMKDKACRWCGAFQLTQIICDPCGGKLIGYRCLTCGRATPK